MRKRIAVPRPIRRALFLPYQRERVGDEGESRPVANSCQDQSESQSACASGEPLLMQHQPLLMWHQLRQPLLAKLRRQNEETAAGRRRARHAAWA